MWIKNSVYKFRYQILLFISIYILHTIYLVNVNRINCNPTEIAAFVVAASMNGNDWSELMKNTDYYGTGFYTLFSPLFALIANPMTRRIIILLVVNIVIVIPSIIVFNIMHYYLEMPDVKFSLIVSFSLSYLAVVRSNMAINEHPLRLIMWLCIYLIICASKTESERSRYIYSILFAFLLAYSNTVHERGIILIFSMFFCVFLHRILFKFKLFNLPLLVSVFLIFYKIAGVYTRFVKETYWVGSTMNNTVSSKFDKIPAYIGYLTDPDWLKALLHVVFGQAWISNIFTCGIFLFSSVLFVMVTYRLLRKKIKIDNPVYIKKASVLYLIFAFSILSVSLTILANGVISMWKVFIDIDECRGNRMYFYMRYFFFLYQPAFAVTMIYIYYQNKKIVVSNLCRISSFVMILMTFFVYNYIVPTTLMNPTMELDRFQYLSPFCLRDADEYLQPYHFAVVITVFFITTVILYMCLKKHKVHLLAILLTCVLIYEYSYSVYNISVKDINKYYDKYDQYYSSIYTDGVFREQIKKLYFTNSRVAAARVAQYDMPELKIHFYDDYDGGEVVLLVDHEITNTKKIFKNYIMLDEDEYLYFNRDELVIMFQEKGFTVYNI